ncbi:MAG: sensor histidine kinase, partial [Candidatus Egerieousia sp.]
MKNISIYIDIAFCILLLPLMIIVFPIERRWGIYLIFFCIFVVWLYITYFSYRYYIIPRLLRGGRERAYALVAIAVSLLITFIFSSYEIKSPFNLLREEQLFSHSFLVWGVRQNKQAIWIHYIVVVFFCLAVGMLSEIYKQKLAREEI